MANTRSASIDVFERLQQKKLELTQLMNRQPNISNHSMEEAMLTELHTQLKRMLSTSKKTLLALHESIIDSLDNAAMETLENDINNALAELKNTEKQKIQEACFNSENLVTLQKEFSLTKETPARTVTPPAEAPTETSTATPASPTQEQPGFLTQVHGFFAKLSTPEPGSPKKIPPTSKEHNLNPEALKMRNAFNKKQTLFPHEDEKKDAPLANSKDEKAPEADAQTKRITRRPARRVDTSELLPTPKTPTKAN
jgi:hypothetical protein